MVYYKLKVRGGLCNKSLQVTKQAFPGFLFLIILQEISLQYLEKAVNFLIESRAESIPNISNISKILLKGAALVIGMASDDAKYSLIPGNENQNKERAKVSNNFYCSSLSKPGEK